MDFLGNNVTMTSTAPFVTTARQYEKQISDLGETTDDVASEEGSEVALSLEEPQARQAPSHDDDEKTQTDEDDNDTGYRMSVEAHLKDEDEEFSLEEEASIKSWRSRRSWRRGGPPRPSAPMPPRVQVYVDISEDTSLPRTSSASAIRSNNNVNPSIRQQSDDLARLLASVPGNAAQPQPSDAFSIQSQTVFTRDDFNDSYWMSALTTNSGYLGLAVIAVTISVAHPLLFLAAALTALGTATAVGASYDYFMECAPCCTTDPTLNTATASTEETIVVQDNAIVATAAPITASPDPAPQPRARPTTESLPPGWLSKHFPSLEFPVLERQPLEGLNVVQFFDVFFSDTAPYNFREFQLQRGDKDVKYGPWKPVQSALSLSMHPAAVPCPPDLEYRLWVERELHFQAKTNNSFLGPPYATTTKRQRCLILSKKFAVLEMKTTLADIPFCDRFYVLERWILQADKDADGVYHLFISSTAAVVWTKSCPFTSQIQSKSRASLTDVGRAWYHMAQQALSLAKQAKLDRMQHEEDHDEEDDDEEEQQAKDELENIPHAFPEQAPKSSGIVDYVVEEKKDEDPAPATPAFPNENIELMHSFTRHSSWVVGEEQDGILFDSPTARSRSSLRRFLPRRAPRVSSVGPRPNSHHRRLARESSADF